MKPASAHHTLKQLLELAKTQQPLTDTIRDTLPENMRSHLLGTALERDTLVVLTDQSSWGTRLRYMAPQLLQAVHAGWPHLKLKQIRVRVMRLPDASPGWRRVPTPPPDEPTLTQMADTAAALRHDNVRQRLKRLSDTLRQRLRDGDSPLD